MIYFACFYCKNIWAWQKLTSMLDFITMVLKFTRPTHCMAAAAVNQYLLPVSNLSSKPAGCRCCCWLTGQMDTQSFYDSYFKLCDCHYKEDWECCFAICCMYADLREVFCCCRKWAWGRHIQCWSTDKNGRRWNQQEFASTEGNAAFSSVV